MNRPRSTLPHVNKPSLVFAADARVLVCPRCGAPEHVPLAGGETTCRFCGAVVQHLARAVVDVHPAAPAAAFEIDRLERLRAQLDVPQPISSAVTHLAGASAISLIADARLAEALTIWGDLAARTRSGDGAAGEELVQLTNALSSTLRERDPLRVRALMETAYEAVRGSTHRNELLGMLARSACLDGDEHGAEGWLAAMDPVSFELRADSAYRSSVAVHLTLRQHCAGVLQVLGPSSGNVPIHVQSTLLTAVLRSNALARLGNEDEARAQLRRIRGGAPLVAQVAHRWGILNLFTG